MSNRLEHLHPFLVKAYHEAAAEFELQYPEAPQPVVVCTFRSNNEQSKLFEEGKTKFKASLSLHNYKPSCAFDIAFISTKAELCLDEKYFRAFAAIITRNRKIQWNGGLQGDKKDITQFQISGYTWSNANRNELPLL